MVSHCAGPTRVFRDRALREHRKSSAFIPPSVRERSPKASLSPPLYLPKGCLIGRAERERRDGRDERERRDVGEFVWFVSFIWFVWLIG